MAEGIVDVLELIYVKHDQHTVFCSQIHGSVQIALLAQQSRQSIQLIPHLVAVQKIQHCDQRDAKPGNVDFRDQDLYQRPNSQKSGKSIDQLPPPVLEVSGHFQGAEQQISNSQIIHEHVNVEAALAGIMVCRIYRKHQTIGKQRASQQKQIQDLQGHCCLKRSCLAFRAVQGIHETDRHCRSQTKAQVIGKDVQPAQPERSVVHQNGNQLQNGNTADQNICN